MKMTQQSKAAQRYPAQLAMITQTREESCLDLAVPLGGAFAPRPEFGLTVGEYYRRKHAAGQTGRFFPLHALVLDKRHEAA